MTASDKGPVKVEQVALSELLAKAPPRPWSYRSMEHDDWGFVRAAPDAEGRRYVICQAKDHRVSREQEDQARRDERDPWEAPARLIVEAVNRIDAQQALVAELAKYARHDGLCGMVGGYDYCTCGLEDALAKVRGGEGR